MVEGIHVLGAGAIGLLHAHHVRTCANVAVTLLLRPAALREFERCNRTLTVTDNTGSESRSTLNAEPAHNSTFERIETLLVSTKAHETQTALAPLLPRLIRPPSSPSNPSVILLIQNGALGVYDHLLSTFPSPSEGGPRFLLSMTTHGVTLRERFLASHAGKGVTVVGDPLEGETPCHVGQHRVDEVLSLLQQLKGLNVGVVSPFRELRRQLLMKLMINASMNPLTALFSCTNGGIADSILGQSLISQVCSELASIIGDDLSMDTAAMKAETVRVAQFNRLNRNSMEVDVSKGRDLELDYIVGYLCKLGERKGLHTPVLKFLMDAVRLKLETVRENKIIH
ncbi:2-dehydropantoate 2-reductase (Ketopantoate reductase) (KPA reductase) (KPR) [Borealophlyctis nickersoniae]|nr:2-dehydropantoate 2-reductase (Ketopantoate reductase) (KPA reductase) (KPR) [Borealophlyctis nickersoniae]